MQNSLPKKAQNYLKEHLREKHWKQVVTVLACIVVFCTTYALILPALTMTGDAFCGKEVHQHSDECYERVLICGQEEAETAEETAAVHTHTDACYETQKVAVCGLEESEGHTHGDSCYDAEGNLTCEQEEAQGHTHTEACYEEESVLICGQEETAPSEEALHVHTDSCYEEKLVCQKEAHEHSLACYSDPNADLEDASAWERSVSGVKLTGVWADDVAAVAQTQLGYEESTKNYLVTEDGEMKGITRFGQWYGEPYGDWDAMFASFCLSYGGVAQTVVPYGDDCAEWSTALSMAGLYRSAVAYSPKKGDLVFFDNNGDGTADHVGIVVQLDENGASFHAAEGDVANRVQQVSHSAGESGLLGYAALPENPNGASVSVTPSENPNGASRAVKQSDDPESIALGETKTVLVNAGEIAKLRFTPAYSHQYVFAATSSGNSYGYLYDADGKQLTADDDSAGSGRFKITYDLTGGETYYWGAGWYSSTTSGDITVSLTLGGHTYAENEQGEYVCACGELVPLSGQCGAELYWAFNPETGTLSITGSGAMYDYINGDHAPWNALAKLVKNVTVAEGATSIGAYAFYACSNLKAVAFPSTLTSVGRQAFSGCMALAEIDLSQTQVTSIGDYAFNACSGLKTAAMPATLETIGIAAFYKCEALTEIDLSQTQVTSIGDYAFNACSGLKTAAMPATLETIGIAAFYKCEALTEIDLSQTQVTSIGDYAFNACSGLKTAAMPATLETIGNYAFYSCSALTEIDLSKTQVTSIGDYAFFSCSALTEIDLSNTQVTSIGRKAFCNCNKMMSISFPDTLETIFDTAFYSCSALTEIDLSKTQVTSIGREAFSRCNKMMSISFPNTLETIENKAFFACSALKEVNLLETKVTSVEKNTFDGCTELMTISLPATLTKIGESAFSDCGFTEIVIPEAVVTVGSNAFRYCAGLTELRIEAKSVAFDPMQSQTSATFHVTVADTVDELTAETIATLARMGCSAISFEGPNYLTAGGWQADFLPSRLSGLPQGEYFADAQGVLYRIESETNTASVFYCPSGIKTYTVPRELPAMDGRETPVPVAGVDSDAFCDASDLTALTFEAPEAITVLADRAFCRAVNLETINGHSDAAGVLATFSSGERKTGRMLFHLTKIAGNSSGQLSGDALVVKKANLTLRVSTREGSYRTPSRSEDGTYLYYTGEAATTTVTVSNPDSSETEDGTVVRVYFYFDGKDGRLNYSAGSHTVVSAAGNSYTMYIVKTVSCYYVELERPKQGDTVSIALESAYPSPASGGGNVTVWCDVLTAEEKTALGSGLLPITTYQSMNWTTAADTFPITKTEKYVGGSTVVGDGTGSAYISGLRYVIEMSRAGMTLEGVGKDHMRSVEFEDVLTLPEGVTLAENVQRSIREDAVKMFVNDSGCYFQTSEGKTILQIEFSDRMTNYRYVRGISLSLDENGNPVFRWRFRNADLKTEIGTISFTCVFQSGTLLVKEPRADQTYTLHNKVTARQHFMYSEDQEQTAACTATVKTASSSLAVRKISTGGDTSYGAPINYTVTAENPGALPYERLAYLTDDLPTQLYMRPADLAATFAEDTEHQLAVTIAHATLCASEDGQPVSAIDGAQTVTDRQNSGANTEYRGMSSTDPDTEHYEGTTITIVWGADGKLQVSDGKRSLSYAPEEAAIRSALKTLGLVVTPKTQYCLKWDFRNADGTVPPLPGGGEIQKKIYGTRKDTFMLLDTDRRNQHPTLHQYFANYAYGRNLNNESLGSGRCSIHSYREFYLDKNWSMNGQSVSDNTEIQQGNILDYTISVTHQGSGQYDALPLVDHLSGAQALLVPAAKNSGAEWAQGLQTVTDDGTEYYVLLTPGTYRNVWTKEDQLADTVTVAQSASGLDTLIKWYFADYTGNRSDTVSYRTYVCPGETVPGALVYSLGNEVWLNDHQSHRLYSPVGWEGTIIGLNKVIVDAVGDTGMGYRSSSVSEGETVVYRLSLRSYTDEDGKPYRLTVTGKDMYDALPLSNSTYRWSKENVRITYQDNYTVTNGDNWSVEVPAAGDQQYIQWADDFSITFAGTAYIYVELDFPSGIPWQEYAVSYATTTLVNSFHVLSAQRSVTHMLTVAAEVRLQKGVYDTGYIYRTYKGYSSKYTSDMSAVDDRLYYQNNDAKIRAVRYYVSLYNGGPTNLYLTDMQDLLPRGFTYFSGNSFLTNNTTGNEVLKNEVASRSMMTASVSTTVRTDEDGRVRLTFHFAQPDLTGSGRIAYDEERQMCYLRPGEYIDFTYICKTNETPDTDDAARNIVTMPYYDFNNGGVIVDGECRIVSYKSSQYLPNDGGCDVLDNGQAENLGFTGGTNDTQWITSDVTVIRGGIKPGITKTLTSKTSVAGETIQEPVSAAPSDTLNWTIKTENDGTDSITDYVLTDRMQAPYMFTGEISYLIYDAPNAKNPVAKPASDYLFRIAKEAEDGTVSVTTGSGEQKTLTIGGDPISLSCEWNYSMLTTGGDDTETTKTVTVLLSIVRDEEGNSVMSLRFPDSAMSIPEYGNSTLTLSTYNSTNLLQNKQFVNTCFVTPLAQIWDGTANKGNVVDLETPFGEGALPTVRNSAPVTISYGYVTSSAKRVFETDKPDNAAVCTDETNYIVLRNETKRFTYTLTVDNSTPKAMDKFVLIDSLPQVGDHTVFLSSDPRFSEFKVSLAADPQFSVTVTDNEGNVTPLPADSYTIEYSEKTEFTAGDWQGIGVWSGSAENARSIRLKIFDATGTLIPAESTLALSFTCVIDDTGAQPGQIAWNSFGYHYRLIGETSELEAAPLKVGVKIPGIPELRKQTVDHSGQPRTVAQDETFRFLVYPGAALRGEYATKEELLAALGDTPYEEFTVTLKAGESLSESVRLKTTRWKWTEGQKYTIVELPCESFAFRRFFGSNTAFYTLTYTPAQTQVVTCENTNRRWCIDLTKENTAHEPLGGAVFALYGPDASDQLSAVPDEYADIQIASTVEHNGRTWYLTSVRTTDADGKLPWSDLLRDRYYLLEVKAPDGYNCSSPAGQILKQEDETQGVYPVTVVNRSGYSMPETGGAGTHLYTLGGSLLLLGAAALLLYYHSKRRRGDEILD